MAVSHRDESWLTPLTDVFNAPDIDWIVDGFIPDGRQVHLVGPAGIGKSLLALYVAIQVALGRTTFGVETRQANVLFLDYENGISTFKERLESYGFNLDTDPDTFSATVQLGAHLLYAPFPEIGDLTTAAAADTITATCASHNVRLVVIDSMAGALNTEENSSQGYIEFGRTTARVLKEANIAALVLDNVGHSVKTRSRGSSRKGDEADLQWVLAEVDEGYLLTRGKDRLGRSPRTIELRKSDGVTLSWDQPHMRPITKKALDVVRSLEALGADAATTNAEARRMLRESGHAARNDVISDALRHLKLSRGTRRGTHSLGNVPGTPGNAQDEPQGNVDGATETGVGT